MRMRYQAVPWVRYIASKDIIQFITKHGKIKNYAKAEVIIAPGVTYPYLSLVISGMLTKGFDVQSKTKNFAYSLILPGSTVGDFYFMTRRICNLKITAIRETSLINIPHEIIENEMFANHTFFRTMMNHLMLDYESDSEGLATITARTTDERLKILLKILLVRYNVEPDNGWYKLPIYLTHNEMSRIIYTTPLTVNRLLLQYKKSGLYIRKAGGQRYVNIDLINDIYDWYPHDPLIKLR